MAIASLNRPSVCSTVISLRRILTLLAMASTATGSGGATIAPSAMATGRLSAGAMNQAAPAATAVVATTSRTASSTSERQRRRKIDQELRWAAA